MKKRFLLSLTLPLSALLFSSYNDGVASKGLGNRTGSTGTTTYCSGGSCHAANTASTIPSLSIVEAFGSGGPYTKYTPGTMYRLVIGGRSTAAMPPSGFGFQLSSVMGAGNMQAGTFQNGSGTRIASSGGLSLLEHNSVFMAASTFGTNEAFWTAPAAGSGPVRFYLTVNAVNTNNASSGDAPNNAVFTLVEDVPSAIADVPEITDFSLYPSPAAETTLHLRIGQPGNEPYTLRITDVTGRQWMEQSMEGSMLQKDITMDITALPVGVYVAQLTYGKVHKRVSFIKK